MLNNFLVLIFLLGSVFFINTSIVEFLNYLSASNKGSENFLCGWFSLVNILRTWFRFQFSFQQFARFLVLL